jgi:hypothetical protein
MSERRGSARALLKHAEEITDFMHLGPWQKLLFQF